MKIKQVFNGLINYLASIGLALVFALFLSGRIGWFILAAFICAPVISLLMTLPFRSKIYVSLETDVNVLSKGDSCELSITIGNDFFLPSPPIMLELYDNPSARCRDKSYSVSVMPYNEEMLSAVYTAKICGPARIGAAEIRLRDYLGIFSFRLKNIDVNELYSQIAVIPDISEISPDDPAIKQAFLLSADADDGEDTSENPLNVSGGFPGYDSREYVPGDPLKRINWKLSAKKSKLFVRLDDETVCSSVTVILDNVFNYKDIRLSYLIEKSPYQECTESSIVPLTAESAVEGSLGIVQTLINTGTSVTYMFCGENGWQVYSVADESDITQLRTDLAAFSFECVNGKNRFPYDELLSVKGTVSIFCTPYYDKELEIQLAEYTGGDSGKGALRTVVFSSVKAPDTDMPKGADADES